MAQRVTTGMLLDHMRAFEGRMIQEIKKETGNLHVRIDETIRHLHHLAKRVNVLETKIDNIDERLDVIEISIVEQKHEKRIRKLERHAGFAHA